MSGRDRERPQPGHWVDGEALRRALGRYATPAGPLVDTERLARTASLVDEARAERLAYAMNLTILAAEKRQAEEKLLLLARAAACHLLPGMDVATDHATIAKLAEVVVEAERRIAAWRPVVDAARALFDRGESSRERCHFDAVDDALAAVPEALR